MIAAETPSGKYDTLHSVCGLSFFLQPTRFLYLNTIVRILFVKRVGSSQSMILFCKTEMAYTNNFIRTVLSPFTKGLRVFIHTWQNYF